MKYKELLCYHSMNRPTIISRSSSWRIIFLIRKSIPRQNYQKELGISRTPLRDAVHRLAQEGYIDIIPSKGFMLHQMNRKDVNETFQVRSALETYCTVQICKEFSSRKAKKLFKDLDWIMECMKDIMETTHSIKEFSEYDFQFHTKIIDYLENIQFSNVFAMFMYRMKRLAELFSFT